MVELRSFKIKPEEHQIGIRRCITSAKGINELLCPFFSVYSRNKKRYVNETSFGNHHSETPGKLSLFQLIQERSKR